MYGFLPVEAMASTLPFSVIVVAGRVHSLGFPDNIGQLLVLLLFFIISFVISRLTTELADHSCVSYCLLRLMTSPARVLNGVQDDINHIKTASTGNRTRASRVAGENSTTEPSMLAGNTVTFYFVAMHDSPVI